MRFKARVTGSVITSVVCVCICAVLIVLRTNGTVKAYTDERTIEEDINKAMQDENAHYATSNTYTFCVIGSKTSEDLQETEEIPVAVGWVDPLSENGLNMSGYDAAYDTAAIAGYALNGHGYKTCIRAKQYASDMANIPENAIVCIDITYVDKGENKVYFNSRFHNRQIGSGLLAASVWANISNDENFEEGIEDTNADMVNPGIPYAKVELQSDISGEIDKEIIIGNGEGIASGILAALEEQ